VTSNDVMRLYSLLDSLRAESAKHMGEVRDEVQGYRADLNGRLRALEQAEAQRRGMDMGRGGVGRMVMGVAAVAAAVGSVTGVVFAIL
jgi:hypothetical protein